MKIYVASSLHQRELARAAQVQLEQAGHTVTSRWLALESPNDPMMCYEDIDGSDAVVVIGVMGRSMRGTHVEFGYAYARNRLILLVDPAEALCPMTRARGVLAVETLDAALKLLEGAVGWENVVVAALQPQIARELRKDHSVTTEEAAGVVTGFLFHFPPIPKYEVKGFHRDEEGNLLAHIQVNDPALIKAIRGEVDTVTVSGRVSIG